MDQIANERFEKYNEIVKKYDNKKWLICLE